MRTLTRGAVDPNRINEGERSPRLRWNRPRGP